MQPAPDEPLRFDTSFVSPLFDTTITPPTGPQSAQDAGPRLPTISVSRPTINREASAASSHPLPGPKRTPVTIGDYLPSVALLIAAVGGWLLWRRRPRAVDLSDAIADVVLIDLPPKSE